MPLAAANPTAFAAAMSQSHRASSLVTIATTTGILIDINSTTYPNAVVVSAEVVADRQAKIRRRCTLRIQDHAGTLVPTSTTSYLTPFGNTLKLYRGVVYDDGTVDRILLGTFRIAEVEIEDQGSSSEIIVTGYDSSRAVSRAKFEDPYKIAAATNFGTAIRTLITDRYAGAIYVTASWTLDGSFPTTPALLFPEGNDPWDRALDLAASVGQELWVDENNFFRLNLQPAPSSTSVANFVWTAGSTSTFSGARRRLTDENIFNKAIISGESTSGTSPVRGTAQDTDATSPTFYNGVFGKVPIFQQRGEITTVAAANTAATALLRLAAGLHEPVTLTMVPDPRVQPGDLVHLTISRLGLPSAIPFIVDAVRMPLGADEEMEVTLQARRLI